MTTKRAAVLSAVLIAASLATFGGCSGSNSEDVCADVRFGVPEHPDRDC